MFSLLLLIIYLAFISLGLPDSLLGSAWPVMHTELGVPLSWSGIIFMTISAGTVVSSLNSGRLIRRIGTGKTMVLSVAMTCVALFGFSISRSFPMLWLWAIPYGLGAGSIDAALNNYVARYYPASVMNLSIIQDQNAVGAWKWIHTGDLKESAENQLKGSGTC